MPTANEDLQTCDSSILAILPSQYFIYWLPVDCKLKTRRVFK